MIEKVTIARLSFIEKDKEGNPLKTRDGKPYTRCLLDTTDGRKMSGFSNPTAKTWQQGDEVEIDVEQNGQYWNFKTPKKEISAGVNQEQLDRIEKMITELHRHMVLAQAKPVEPLANRLPDYPMEEIRPEDIPF
jgi:hypothetical protein